MSDKAKAMALMLREAAAEVEQGHWHGVLLICAKGARTRIRSDGEFVPGVALDALDSLKREIQEAQHKQGNGG